MLVAVVVVCGSRIHEPAHWLARTVRWCAPALVGLVTLVLNTEVGTSTLTRNVSGGLSVILVLYRGFPQIPQNPSKKAKWRVL